MITSTTLKTDNVGIVASTLCMIHCMATPFLFLAKSCSVTCCASAPGWWRSLDFLFLVISLYAVYKSSKTTVKQWVKYAMWLTWLLLFTLLMNEALSLVTLFQNAMYIPAILLVLLHVYNLKYCGCNTTACHKS